jgi:hypothetical protein
MATDDFEFRLQETGLPDGEISLNDIASLAGRLQELATRVGRWVTEQEGPGRTRNYITEIAALRLRRMEEGSTRLVIGRGAADQLEVRLPLEQEVDDRFWQIMAALGTDAPPVEAPPGVLESGREVLEALTRASKSVSITRSRDGARTEFRPAEKDREAWRVADEESGGTDLAVTGRLKALDLESGRFKIRDDAGNAIHLHSVVEPELAARLVGQRATAVGRAILGPDARVRWIESPSITAATPLSESWTPGRRDDSWRDRIEGTGPDPRGGAEFSEDEWEGFLEAVRGS